MSDFISNRSDGKSDFYTPSQNSSPQEETSTTSCTDSDQESPFTDSGAVPPVSPSTAWSVPPYSPPQVAPSKSPANSMATASMILGIISWAGWILCCGCFSPITAILAIIFAAFSRDDEKMSPRGIAGLVLGITFLCALCLILFVALSGGISFYTYTETEEILATLFYQFFP